MNSHADADIKRKEKEIYKRRKEKKKIFCVTIKCKCLSARVKPGRSGSGYHVTDSKTDMDPGNLPASFDGVHLVREIT